jgi:hypothetical protein
VLLSFETLAEVLRLGPAFEDVVAFEDIGDDAGDVFGEVLLAEPDRVEPDFVPGNAVELGRQPDFGAFGYFGLDWEQLMALGGLGEVNGSLFGEGVGAEGEGEGWLGVVAAVEVLRTAVAVHSVILTVDIIAHQRFLPFFASSSSLLLLFSLSLSSLPSIH